MGTLKNVGNNLKNNWKGAILGGIAGYFVAKKAIKTEKKWVLGVSIAVGAIVGAGAEYKIKAATVKPAIAAAKK